MPITPETGEALADSYTSLEDATAYHAAMGNAAWAEIATDTEREVLLRRATRYMVQAYRARWKGARLTASQALCWPRVGVVADGFDIAPNAVPAEVRNACAELALRAMTQDLAPDVQRKTTREKVDVIEVEYDKNAPQWVQFRAVDAMLRPYLSGVSSVCVGLVRA